MTGLLEPLLLTMALGGAVGLAAQRGLRAPRPGVLFALLAGAAGGVTAGFLLPQAGLPVSRSLAMGLAVTAAGAALAVVMMGALLDVFAVKEGRLRAFRMAALLGVWLCLLDAALVLASLVHVRSQSPLAVSVVVAAMFAAVALLLLQLRRHLTDAVVAVGDGPPLSDAARSLHRLLLPMTLGATALDGVLLLTAFAFASRMRQGFPIFG
jgi:uncharacterized membrane protein YeaQ/YmgE (transglycosylase-associated protein family)